MTEKPMLMQHQSQGQGVYATQPTDFTRHLRTNLIWQIWRFIAINLKMVRIISKSHH